MKRYLIAILATTALLIVGAPASAIGGPRLRESS
jgi:hypothetical protein